MRPHLCLAALAAATAGYGAGASTPDFGHAGRWILDTQGRVVILHGLNIVAKLPPNRPDAIGFGPAMPAFLAGAGFDTVRLGIVWTALEPRPGRFDDGYLASIARTVRVLETHGIDPVIDFHQDMYNERFQGEGFPAWAVQPDGIAAVPQRGFPANYSTMPALSRAHENFWRNRPGVSHFLVVGGPSISPNTIESEYSGGMSFDHANPSVVYLSRKVRGYFQIERWSTANAGASWTHVAITSRRGVDNIRPVVARGAPGGLLWLSGHYGSYKAYHTKIVGRESDQRV